MFSNLPKFTPPRVEDLVRFHPQEFYLPSPHSWLIYFTSFSLQIVPALRESFINTTSWQLSSKPYVPSTTNLTPWQWWAYFGFFSLCRAVVLSTIILEQQLIYSFLDSYPFYSSIYDSKDSLGKLQIIFKQLCSKKYKALFKDGLSELLGYSAPPGGERKQIWLFYPWIYK